jgi:hypothetical protein
VNVALGAAAKAVTGYWEEGKVVERRDVGERGGAAGFI